MDDESGGPEHRHGEPSIESIQFDADGWTLLPGPPEARRWRDALGNTLQLSAHPGSPDYLEGSADLLSIRAFCRQQADQRGRAIVSVEKTDIAGMDCLSVISKCDGPGYGYHGTITIPADGGCFQFEMVRFETHADARVVLRSVRRQL